MVAVVKSKRQLDLEFGRECERLAIPVLNAFFKEEHVRDPNWYDRWDFWNPTRSTRREVKGRRIGSKDYKTALVNNSKIINHKDGINYTYIWYYTDGWYYLEYDANVWTKENGFFVAPQSTLRDGKWETEDCMNVPHRFLKPMV